MSGVDAEGFLLVFVVSLGSVVSGLVGLGLHDSLHVGGPSVLGGDERGGGLVQDHRDLGLLDSVHEGVVLEPLGQVFVLSIHLLLVVGIGGQVYTVLGNVLEAFPVELGEG